MRERLDDVLARVDDPDAVGQAFLQLQAALDQRRDERRRDEVAVVSSEAKQAGWIRRLWPFLARHKRKVFIAFGVSLARP